jgi:hypothetical protein
MRRILDCRESISVSIEDGLKNDQQSCDHWKKKDFKSTWYIFSTILLSNNVGYICVVVMFNLGCTTYVYIYLFIDKVLNMCWCTGEHGFVGPSYTMDSNHVFGCSTYA